ncbi:transferase hexapeptide (six repeat-containing protein) [Bizionia echini]|uniref:Transferase hexapeptide (Six repeat-containing protein) n=1 Tax=Bizionia echini TaxID=649333 RepID=A0A1I5BCA8_9FLAO|nr:serine acetyltransferase [Bizionia echini]SFN72354.1 transferase hexapeptide (six repeat-containing protein) [Bizionia echini]
MKPNQLLTHAFKKLLLWRLYNRYVIANAVIQADIKQTLQVRGSQVQYATIDKQFYHAMIYYQDYAYIFFWRINKLGCRWRYLFMNDMPCKLFRSTEIAGGLMCYHPFATVINAKSIGRNFQFRNGLTVGNKGNDNSQLPIIGNDVSVGANVVIIGAITIGDNVTIGAGSVVVKNVPSNCIIAGNPAHIIRRQDEA